MKKILFVFALLLLSFASSFAQEKQPKVIKYKAPTYPPLAIATMTQGIVIISVKLDKNGEVLESTAISGHLLLKQVAEQTAKQWLFSTNKNDSERSLQIQFIFSIKENKQVKNNYKTRIYKIKFKKPYSLEIISTIYPQI